MLSIDSYIALITGIVGFSLFASSVYIINDILDLANDRAHQTKRNRPLASCNISIKYAFLILSLLLVIGCLITLIISFNFFICCALYLILNIAYSIKLKSIAILDCILLSLMYTYRIYIGTIITNLEISTWLISFSFFLFLFLAFIKRFAELYKAIGQNKSEIKGRGYSVNDIDILKILSSSSGLISVLVFNLYLADVSIRSHFNNIWFAYACIPILIYWVCYFLLTASRGKMNEDPVSFALQNRLSLVLGLIFVITFWISIY